MNAREHHRDVVAYLESVGASDIRIELSGTHPAIVFRWAGAEHRCGVSNSPSDFRSTKKAIQSLRHRLGLVGGKRVGKRRKARRRDALGPIVSEGRATRFRRTRDIPALNTPFAGLSTLLAGAAE